jgi:hypothetical protein
VNLAGSIALVTMVYYAGIAPPLATAAGVAGRKAGLNFTQVCSPYIGDLKFWHTVVSLIVLAINSGAAFSSANLSAFAECRFSTV